ncbi:MAG: ethanolamine ammonia-lyase subunit EutC [Stagnimonas sp.]|nr:ethanolamine ammonia-lyase subunit EutC [Stagnimonas sp.]
MSPSGTSPPPCGEGLGEGVSRQRNEHSDGSRPPPQPLPAKGRGYAEHPSVSADPWSELRLLTPARLALGRAGAALPTAEVLAFGLAHAQARDAVHTPLDVEALATQLQADGWPEPLLVHSRAADRAAYLARPDWGRRLSEDSLLSLPAAAPADLVLVIADGLSATAVQRHAVPLLRALRPWLTGLRLAPPVIALQARVALADEVGERLGAALAVSLIGERPGLSSPDSLGIYLTWAPRLGHHDAERNCISNVRPEGLGYVEAARQLAALIHQARAMRCSGLRLRGDATALPPPG